MTDSPGPQIVGLHVRRYKNLTDVWMPWSDGIAVVGVNGSGKTNLLESVTALVGTPTTLELAGPRLQQPAAGALALLVRHVPEDQPWPPEDASHGRRVSVGKDHEGVRGVLDEATAWSQWWDKLGTTAATTLQAALQDVLPTPVCEFVTALLQDPVVAYRLQSVDLPPTADASPPRRSFSRVLLATAVPDDVMAHLATLPPAFDPLRGNEDDALPGTSGLVPVLRLPDTGVAPADLQWLPRTRTSEEVQDDLADAFLTASEPAANIAAIMGELAPFASPPEQSDWHWWLTVLTQNWARRELESTAPGVSVYADGSNDADLYVTPAGQPGVSLGRTVDDDVLDMLSAAQRRWTDEAFATAARQLRRFAVQAELYTGVLLDPDEDTLLTAALSVAAEVEPHISGEHHWAAETFDRLLGALDSYLVAGARAATAHDGSRFTRAMLLQLTPADRFFEPRLTVRVFDEPEAHLHATAQWQCAGALDNLRLREGNVLIASHSAAFLDLVQRDGWSVVHVDAAHGEAKVRALGRSEQQAHTSVAKQLGVGHGDLLGGIRHLLIVEGEHDALVLDRLYGGQLRAAGVAVVRMRGTNNLLSVVELDFVSTYLDAPRTVLTDYTRVERVNAGRTQTDEEEKIAELQRACRRRGIPLTLRGLERPDVVCYLSETAMLEVYPTFPGWKQAIKAFGALRRRPRFKTWLAERYQVDIDGVRQISRVLDVMRDGGHQPPGELPREINSFLAALDQPHDRGPALV